MQPICGKVDVLLAHLIKCRNITDVKVKQWAANANEVKKVKHKELNMNIPTAPILYVIFMMFMRNVVSCWPIIQC